VLGSLGPSGKDTFLISCCQVSTIDYVSERGGRGYSISKRVGKIAKSDYSFRCISLSS
jgi:hypothetical protein